MDDKELSKLFATKLSLPKFINMMKRLTLAQRTLVHSIGFEHLLYLSCDQLPRGLIIYLVTNFDAQTRSLKLPNGACFIITPDCINKVLGTPIGGRQIGGKADSELRSFVADLTKCKGQYPTISELDSLITPELIGDKFKLIYTMFAMTAFLCPSSHDGLSPMYLHIFKNADEIILFDFSSAILEKLVSSIQTFKQRPTCVLGGNLLSLMAIYFEFIDADVIPSPSNSDLPRLSIWTTSLVSKIETMDCVCKVNSQYGRLPLKDVSDTIFGYIYKKGQQMDGKSYKDLMNFVLSICPENHHTVVKQQLHLIMANMRNEIMQSIEPIFVENILKVMSMLQFSKSMDGNNNPSSFKTRKVLSNEPLPIEHPYCSQLNSKLCASGVNSAPRPLYLESGNALVVADCSKQGNKKDDSSTIRETHGKDKEDVDKDSLAMVISNDSLIMQKEEGVANHLLLLPVPSIELLDTLNEEAYSKWRSSVTQSLTDSLKSIQVSSEIDLPYNLELIESMYPKKDDTASFDEYIYSTIDITSYVLEEVEAHRNLSMSKDGIDCLVYEKVHFMEDYDVRSRTTSYHSAAVEQSGLNPCKRTSNISTNDMASHCIALKKRAKMFKLNEDHLGSSEIPLVARTSSLAGSHEQIESSDCTKADSMMDHDRMIKSPEQVVGMNFAMNEEDCPAMTEAEWERELLRSTLQIEAEHMAKVRNTQITTEENGTFNVSELTPNKLICTFTSTQVEKDVFIDITERVPRTVKAKSINVVRMGTTWAEHRVFALSMQVYGNINKYVMNMLGKAVMVEDAEKKNLGLLPTGHWKRYYYEFDIAVHLPLFTDGFYFLLTVNFRQKLFEVLYPNTKFHLICDHANVAIKNFKMAFKIAYKHSHVDIQSMESVFRSVCSSQKDSDSGIFVMELIRNQKDGNILCFEPNHAKPLRESLTYYMLAHPFNEKMPPETKNILKKHNIPYDFKIEGYYPWMHEQCETSTQDPIDPIERMVLF
uniref:Uncharacterized protein n=2 Tax=Avena sativa TaxID=4498 RepID=A0ACD5YV00_AVESA